MRRQPATDPALKARALQLAEEVGAAEAARRTGIPDGTIRQWRRRQKAAAPRVEVPGSQAPESQGGELDEVERLEREYRAEQGIAIRALAKANEALTAGKANDSKLYMTTHGIARDKARDLLAQLHAAREHRARLVRAQAELLGEVIRFYLVEVLGLSLEAGARAALAHLLRQAGSGEALTVPAEGEAARRELLDHVADEVRRRLPDLEPDWGDRTPLGLPAPSDKESGQAAAGPDGMVGPVLKVKTFREQARGRRTGGHEPEVVDGEVLPPKDRPGGRRPRRWTMVDGVLRRVE